MSPNLGLGQRINLATAQYLRIASTEVIENIWEDKMELRVYWLYGIGYLVYHIRERILLE